MELSLVYLVSRFFYRIYRFIYNWYIGSWLWFYHSLMTFYESLDRTWAFNVTLRSLFKPMYQDRSVIGYVLGFVFRFFRLLIGGVIYLFLFLIMFSLYLIWAVMPIYIIYWGVVNS